MICPSRESVMRVEAWNSSPSFLSENKGRRVAAACFLVGLLVLFISLYVFATEFYFFHQATALETAIVEIRHEYVPAGRGSVLGYVPVVENPITRERIAVDTYNEENIYSVGGKMRVLCDLSVSRRCIRNRFFDTWWGTVDLILALLLLAPSWLYLRRSKQQADGALTLNA